MPWSIPFWRAKKKEKKKQKRKVKKLSPVFHIYPHAESMMNAVLSKSYPHYPQPYYKSNTIQKKNGKRKERKILFKGRGAPRQNFKEIKSWGSIKNYTIKKSYFFFKIIFFSLDRFSYFAIILGKEIKSV